MTQNEKDLLLKDLCSRLPYGVKAEILNEENERKQVVVSYGNICYIPELGNWWWKECKPYLFPLSSMTDEQKEEYVSLQQRVIYNSRGLVNSDVMKYTDWCYKHHIDINGLIPKGWANDATDKNIY